VEEERKQWREPTSVTDVHTDVRSGGRLPRLCRGYFPFRNIKTERQYKIMIDYYAPDYAYKGEIQGGVRSHLYGYSGTDYSGDTTGHKMSVRSVCLSDSAVKPSGRNEDNLDTRSQQKERERAGRGDEGGVSGMTIVLGIVPVGEKRCWLQEAAGISSHERTHDAVRALAGQRLPLCLRLRRTRYSLRHRHRGRVRVRGLRPCNRVRFDRSHDGSDGNG
jgi:hypothetical protein